MTENEIYDYFAKIIFQYSYKDPDFIKIASEYQVKIYSNTIGTDYLILINKQYQLGLISDNFYNFVQENYNDLLNMIIWERDNLIDYFGLKTLEKSYLLKDLDKKFIQLAEDYKVSLYEVMRLRYNREHDILQYIENVTKK